MKAVIRYKDWLTNKRKQKTVDTEINEPNHIIRLFAKKVNAPAYTVVTTVKCGRYEYQWFNPIRYAGVGGAFD